MSEEPSSSFSLPITSNIVRHDQDNGKHIRNRDLLRAKKLQQATLPHGPHGAIVLAQHAAENADIKRTPRETPALPDQVGKTLNPGDDMKEHVSRHLRNSSSTRTQSELPMKTVHTETVTTKDGQKTVTSETVTWSSSSDTFEEGSFGETTFFSDRRMFGDSMFDGDMMSNQSSFQRSMFNHGNMFDDDSMSGDFGGFPRSGSRRVTSSSSDDPIQEDGPIQPIGAIRENGSPQDIDINKTIHEHHHDIVHENIENGTGDSITTVHGDIPISPDIHDRVRQSNIGSGPNIEHTASDKKRGLHFTRDLVATAASKMGSINVTDAGVNYTTIVSVGSPAQQFKLLIDTGSSTTSVGAGSVKYRATSTATRTGATYSVIYGLGTMTGDEYLDTVSLGSGLTVTGQSIAAITSTQNVSDNVDGVLGIGPVALTAGMLSTGQLVPTIVDNLFTQGVIASEIYGISFQPTVVTAGQTDFTTFSVNGELSFGYADKAKYTGSIYYFAVTTTMPAGLYWGIDLYVGYGQYSLSGTISGILDTGTTSVLLATDVFNTYIRLVGATFDANVGMYAITQSQYNRLQPLYFNIGGYRFTFPANAQIWPRAANVALGGSTNKLYLIIDDLGTNSGQGLDFVLGFTWLQRYYTIYDTSSHRIGLAATPYTLAQTN